MTPNEFLPLILVPGFERRAWDVGDFGLWRDRIVVTGRLKGDSLEELVSRVLGWTGGLASYALVGDALGAVVALELATRRPAGLRAVVLSGPFLPIDLRAQLPEIRARMNPRDDFDEAQLERGLEIARSWRPGATLAVPGLVSSPGGSDGQAWARTQPFARWSRAAFTCRFDEPGQYARSVQEFLATLEERTADTRSDEGRPR